MFCSRLAIPSANCSENNYARKHFCWLSVTKNTTYRMNIRPLVLFFLLSFVKPLESICGDPAAITQEELVRRTQELFDAVVPGNKEPWQKYFADDCIFADEKGRNFNKTQLVADITPLPKGYQGTIKIARTRSVIH